MSPGTPVGPWKSGIIEVRERRSTPVPPLDISANRSAAKWSRKELFGRALWGLVGTLYCCSPRLIWGFRALVLRCFGASVGPNVHLFPSARVFIPWQLSIGDWSSVGFDALIYNLGQVTIGRRVTISQRAHLCAGTHDHRDPTMPLVKVPITIHDDAWICADAFIGPGVTIGEGAVVGARAVVVKNVEPWTIVAGNPARLIGRRVLETKDSRGMRQ